jgi:hypothetical protein
LKFSGDQPLADDLCLVTVEVLLNKPLPRPMHPTPSGEYKSTTDS